MKRRHRKFALIMSRKLRVRHGVNCVGLYGCASTDIGNRSSGSREGAVEEEAIFKNILNHIIHIAMVTAGGTVKSAVEFNAEIERSEVTAKDTSFSVVGDAGSAGGGMDKNKKTTLKSVVDGAKNFLKAAPIALALTLGGCDTDPNREPPIPADPCYCGRELQPNPCPTFYPGGKLRRWTAESEAIFRNIPESVMNSCLRPLRNVPHAREVLEIERIMAITEEKKRFIDRYI